MNWKRITLGGLVAGLVLNVGEFVVEPLMGPYVEPLMGPYMEQFFDRLGLPVRLERPP